jgi:hypothetical protein
MPITESSGTDHMKNMHPLLKDMMAATRTLLPVGPNMPIGPLPGREDDAFPFVSFVVTNIYSIFVYLKQFPCQKYLIRIINKTQLYNFE